MVIAIGNDELKEPIEKIIKCPRCYKNHRVRYPDKIMPDGTKQPSKLFAIIKCKHKSYLVGLDGKKI